MDQKIQGGKVYRSLSQNVSDSDEELFNIDTNDIKGDRTAVASRQVDVDRKFETFSTVEANECGHFDDNIEFFNGKPNSKQKSTVRRYIVISIMIYTAITITFFYLAPCHDCKQRILWTKTLPKLDLIRPIAYIVSRKSLIVTYQNSKWDNIRDSGLISVGVDFPNRTWHYRFLQDQLPENVNCSLADFNGDNQTDCVLFRSNGLLKIINSIDSATLWSLVSHIPFDIKKISYPLVLEDVNNDEINDLLLVINYNRICVIDGQNGELLLDPIDIERCKTVKHLKTLPKTCLEYICDEDRQPQRLCYYPNWRLDVPLKVAETVTDDTWTSTRNSKHNLATFYYNETGQCPENCSLRYHLQNYVNKTIWSLSVNNSTAMRPVIKSNSHKDQMYLLLKFWTFLGNGNGTMHGNNFSGFLKMNFSLNYFNETLLFLKVFRDKFQTRVLVRTIFSKKIMQLCLNEFAGFNNECQPELFSNKDSLFFDESDSSVVTFSSSYEILNGTNFQLASEMLKFALNNLTA